jgi:hypothetical protein
MRVEREGGVQEKGFYAPESVTVSHLIGYQISENIIKVTRKIKTKVDL